MPEKWNALSRMRTLHKLLQSAREAASNPLWQLKDPSFTQAHAQLIYHEFTFSSTDPPVPWPGFSPERKSSGRIVRDLRMPRTTTQAFLKARPLTQKPTTTHSDSPSSESTGDHNSDYERFTSHSVLSGSGPQAFTAPSFTLRSHKVRRNADARYSIILGTSFPLPSEFMDVQNPLHQFTTQVTDAPVMSTTQCPRRDCVVCGDGDQAGVLSPCEHCDKAYCKDCLHEMFVAASNDSTRMPPRCCAMIQMHIGLPLLNETDRSAFKNRFEEWISTHRLYCPKKHCSAFIPDRIVHATIPVPSMKQRLGDSHANVEPVVLSRTVKCQECWCSVCLDCHQPSHIGRPCDFSQDTEMEKMLEKLKYKTCPNCRTGVRRMHGCPHMQCRCGAHWCWFCKSPIKECNGAHVEEEEEVGTDEEDLEQGFEEDESEDDVTDEEPDDGGDARVVESAERAVDADNDTIMVEAGPMNPTASRFGPGASRVEQVNGHSPRPQTVPSTEEVENLDALGYQDWDNGGWNFGEEPEEARSTIWGCRHRWKQVRATEVKHVERSTSVYCNCCFIPIRMSSQDNVPLRSNVSQEAYACTHCNVLFCDRCRNTLHPLQKE